MPSFTDKLTVNGHEMDMYASIPSGSGPFPAVVIAFHVGGLDEFDKAMADRLAAEGYVAVVPDLFHRLTEEQMNGPRLDRLGYLSDPDIIADCNAAVSFLQGNSAVDSNRIGVTGFCMGGRVAWLMAASNPVFKATVPYYGGHIMLPWGDTTETPFDLTSNINCPMMFHFGATDGNPSPDDRVKLDAELTRLGKEHVFYSYEGAGHAFMDFTNPDRHHEGAAAESWPRTLEFFAKHLKGAAVGR
ncbi:MAG: dienelactone hydrolase family protein [Chloroflexi bacterium]|nr:dienelactone hydrolase family protein [Chloroflexota bacterium]